MGLVRVDDSHAKVLVPLDEYDVATLRNLSGLVNQVAAYAQSIDLGSTFSPVASIFKENPCEGNLHAGVQLSLRTFAERDACYCDPTTAVDSNVHYYILFEPSGN